jgi:glucose-6-phosphate isomerase
MVANKNFIIKNLKLTIPKSSNKKLARLTQKYIEKINNLEFINEIRGVEKLKSLIKGKNLTSKDLVLFGLGGSSLGTKTIIEGLGHQEKTNRKIYIIDNLDGETFEQVFKKIKIRSTNFIFVSKSGSTFEIKGLLKEVIKKINAAKVPLSPRIFFITEDNNGHLNSFGKKEGIHTFHINPDIGGRFSVLSRSTLLPCEMVGVKWKRIIKGALDCYEQLYETKFTSICALSDFYYENLLKGKDVTAVMSYKDSLESFGEWFMQLWAESLGKTKSNGASVGLTPARYLGPKDQHSQMQLVLDGPKNKTITFISTKNNSRENSSLGKHSLLAKTATIKALRIKKVPHVQIEINKLDEEGIGQLFIVFQLTTVLLAKRMRINPFDQPAVELIKRNLKF